MVLMVSLPIAVVIHHPDALADPLFEVTKPTGNDPPNGLACFGMSGVGLLGHALLKFKTHGPTRAVLWDCLVNISRHPSFLVPPHPDSQRLFNHSRLLNFLAATLQLTALNRRSSPLTMNTERGNESAPNLNPYFRDKLN